MSRSSLESPDSPGVWQNGSRAPALATLPGTEKLYARMKSLFEYLLQPTQRTRVHSAVSDAALKSGLLLHARAQSTCLCQTLVCIGV